MNKIRFILSIIAYMAMSTIAWSQAQDPPAASAGRPTIGGNVFGGGRMANVSNTATQAVEGADTVTATIDIYASTIKGGVFGGNDITGAVKQASGDDKASAQITIHDACDGTCSVKEVYGGGNGYYKYKIDDTTIEIGKITEDNKDTNVAANTCVKVLDKDGKEVAEFYTTEATTYAGLLPSMGNTSVTIGEAKDAKNNIALAEVYGGAKNAYVLGTSSVTVESGTIGKVFAGNNVGGNAQSSMLTINGTKKPTTEPTNENFASFDWSNVGAYDTENGFGIGEAYGGGNAVDVLTAADVKITGGYVGALFGGNNLADMTGVPNVSLKGGNIHTVYGGGNAGDMKGVEGYLLGLGTYLNSSLIDNWTEVKQTVDGKVSGFQMNRFPAFMSTIVSLDADNLRVGNVYGGCRAANVDYSSYIRITNAAYVGDVYGGCDMAGAVGVGPMNGDANGKNYKAPKDLKCKVFDYTKDEDVLAENYTFPSPPATGANYTVKEGVPMYYVGTYVTMTGGTVNGKIFGGGNGEYTYTVNSDNWDVKAVGSETVLATIPQSKGKPWVVGANVIVEGGTINDNVYLGGNEAPVGKDYTAVAEAERPTYYGKQVADFFSMPSYLLIGHTVRTQTNTNPIQITKDVFCGGRKADVYSVVDALVKNNVEVNRFFAGNDISGQVEGSVRTSSTDSSFPYYPQATTSTETVTTHLLGGTNSLSGDPITDITYVRVEGAGKDVKGNVHPAAKITTLFGGGNGDYNYSDGEYKGLEEPYQESTYLDVAGCVTTAYGGGNAADIGTSNLWIVKNAQVETAFAGSNSATARNNAQIFVNCNPALYVDGENTTSAHGYIIDETDTNLPKVNNKYNVGTLFGGNNIAEMQIVPEIMLMHGKIGTVYGGGNAGDMSGYEGYLLGMGDYLNDNLLDTELNKHTFKREGSSEEQNNAFQMNRFPIFPSTIITLDAQNTTTTESGYTTGNGLRVDCVYGGCRAANVAYSTYIHVAAADYVGTLYGGCDVSGGVGIGPMGGDGHTAVFNTDKDVKCWVYDNTNRKDIYAETFHFPSDGAGVYYPYTVYKGAMMRYVGTYVTVTGGTIQGNVFGGGNGEYDYTHEEYKEYASKLPWVIGSNVIIEGGTFNDDIYLGGNKATVGREVGTGYTCYGQEVKTGKLSMPSHLLIGQTVRTLSGIGVDELTSIKLNKNVFCGGRMANVYASVDALIKKNTEIGSLFAGNDISGSVIGRSRSERTEAYMKLDGTDLYGTGMTYPTRSYRGDAQGNTEAGYNNTDVKGDNAQVYIRIEGGGNFTYAGKNFDFPAAKITNLFGGGNGDYDYTTEGSSYYGLTKPVQTSCWLDVKGVIGTSYGGGNAADIEKSNTYITGNALVGTAFAGGNAATVTKEANIYVDCNPAVYVDGQNIRSSDGYIYVDDINNKSGYKNDVYHVDTLFGGNNIADMAIVPNIQLFHGKIGTVYGGGNAGNMTGVQGFLLGFSTYLNDHLLTGWSKVGKDRNSDKADGFQMSRFPVFISTNVTFDAKAATTSASGYTTGTGLRVDKTYGGCKAADVNNSTYIRVSAADYVGDVYGGCDIAGGVGVGPLSETSGENYTTKEDIRCWVYDNATEKDVYADTWHFPSDAAGVYKKYTIENGTVMRYVSTYVTFTGGEIRGKVYGGGNGDYNYTTDYSSYADNKPWVVGSNVIVEGGTFYDNIYLGGNAATVGKNLGTGSGKYYYGQAVEDYLAMPSHLLIGKTVRTTTAGIDIKKDVYCGGRMADIYSTVDALVKKEVKINAMFAGNDISGSVSGRGRDSRTDASPYPKGTDLIGDDMPDATKTYYASTGLSSTDSHVYVRVEPNAEIGTLFGGGNGDYDYSSTGDHPGLIKPYQKSSWLDIRGKIGTVYGGGNAADNNRTAVYVMGEAEIGTSATPGAVYGGCRSANVDYRSRTLVAPFISKTGTVTAPKVNGNVFGGCDISGNVGDCTKTCRGVGSDIDKKAHFKTDEVSASWADSVEYARVSLYGGTITGRIFGGGNGLESADGTLKYQTTSLPTVKDGTAEPNETYVYADGTYAGKTLPQVANSWVAVRGTAGQQAIVGTNAGNDTHTVFGGGQGAGTRVIHNAEVELGNTTDNTLVNGTTYGGSYAGFVNTSCDDITRTVIQGMGANTEIKGDIYGGSYGNYVRGSIELDINNASIGVDDTQQASIYAGNNAAAQPECNACINYVGSDCNVALFGGGNKADFYGTTRITFTTGDIGYIYGGGNNADVYGNTIVEVLGGHVCHDVFGGGNNGAVKVWKHTDEHPTPNGTNYGGNTMVIVRDDCLQLGPDTNGKNPGDEGYIQTFLESYGNRQANRGITSYFNTNEDGTEMTPSIDPYTAEMQMYVLNPNDKTDPKRSKITIDGNVYGGGNNADVEGKTTVIIGDK